MSIKPKCFTLLVIIVFVLNSCATSNSVNTENSKYSLEYFEKKSEVEILADLANYFKIIELGYRDGRALSIEELNYARILGINDPEGIRVLEYKRIPLILKSDFEQVKMMGINPNDFDPQGASYPRTIMLRKDNPDKLTTLIHELVHIKQVQLMGFIKMYSLYNYELYMNGYDDISLEIEAREKSFELQN